MTRVFDQAHYERLNATRGAVIRPVLADLRRDFAMRTAADVGCGLGYFTVLLADEGLVSTGIDGRADNVEECRRRHGRAEFRIGDIEDPLLPAQGRFDLVVCLGLLYHLENPFRAMRNLEKLTAHALILESMCVPSPYAVMDLRDECGGEDQGLNYVAFYPSEACLIKMLYRAGFSAVFRFAEMPDHDHFRETAASHQVRTMLVAARAPLGSARLIAAPEPANAPDPWAKPWARVTATARRVKGALGKISRANGRGSAQQRGQS